MYDYFDAAQRILQPFHKKSLFKEQYTTPIPSEREQWTYDLESGLVYNPTGKTIPYIHFLFFKKTQYLNTDIYWRDDYYKLPDNMNWENSRGKVIISTEGITYKDK